MSEEIKTNVGISSTFDPAGTHAAASGLNETKAAAEGAKTAAVDLTAAAEALATAFVQLFAMAEIVSFFKDATTEAYNNEKALRGVAQAALIAGLDMDVAKKQADAFTHALAIQTGIIKTELLDAYGKVFIATGNVTEAQKEVTLAANIATVRHMDMAQALKIVESAAMGVPGRFQKIMGTVIEGTTALEKHNSMTEFLVKNYGDVSKVTDDAAAATDRSNRRWDEFKETVGGPVLGVIAKLKDGIALLPRMLTLISDLSVVWADALKARVGAVAEFLKTVWKGPAEAFAVYAVETEAIEKKRDDDIKKAYARNLAEQQAMDKAATVAAVKELDFRGKEEAAVVDKWLRNRMSGREAELRHADAVEQELDAHFVAGVNRRLAESKRELAEYEKFADQKLAAMLHEIEAEERADKAAHAAKKARAKEELRMQVDVANAGLGLLGEVFGQSKELSIAQAIISTYEGAAKALSQGGIYGIVLAALVIAAGLVHVAKIESTDATTKSVGGGAGFDDPSNDAAAYRGGRKWANDMISQFSGGASSVSQGWSAGMSGSTTNNNSQVTNINVSGGLIDPNSREWMKQFGRRLAIVMHSDSQRSIARKT